MAGQQNGPFVRKSCFNSRLTSTLPRVLGTDDRIKARSLETGEMSSPLERMQGCALRQFRHRRARSAPEPRSSSDPPLMQFFILLEFPSRLLAGIRGVEGPAVWSSRPWRSGVGRGWLVGDRASGWHRFRARRNIFRQHNICATIPSLVRSFHQLNKLVTTV